MPKKQGKGSRKPAGNSPKLVRGEERIMPKTDVDKLLEELQGLEERKQAAIESLIEERDEAMAEFDRKLKLLGYEPTVKAEKKQVKTFKNPCPICKFMTEPYHDSRHKAHRRQEEKAPFTDEELKEYKLKRVD